MKTARSNPAVIDRNLKHKGRIINGHIRQEPFLPNGVPAFSHVEFNICGLCSRTCVFCPRSDPEIYPNRAEFLSPDLYERALIDLAAIDYCGGISYSGFSEPLYHKQLSDMVRMTKRHVPKALLWLNTNGDILDPAMMADLYAAGLNDLFISLYDGPKQHDHFTVMAHEAGVPLEWVTMRVRYLKESEHYGLKLSNRAGLVKNLSHLGIRTPEQPLERPCSYPLYLMVIDHNGDVLLCTHDWGKKYIAGNLADSGIVDIWSGRAMNEARKRLMAADRRFAPCAQCDALGTVQGKNHMAVWQSYFARRSE